MKQYLKVNKLCFQTILLAYLLKPVDIKVLSFVGLSSKLSIFIISKKRLDESLFLFELSRLLSLSRLIYRTLG